MPSPKHLDTAPDFAHCMRAAASSSASAEALWREISHVGGANGWYYLDWLWQLRGLIDHCVGGVGMRRTPRRAGGPQAGDAFDFWRVASAIPGDCLTLVSEMKLSGRGVLEFELSAAPGNRTRLEVSAYFDPDDAIGRLYWSAMKPFHALIFRGLARAIVRRAEAAQA